ncbi:hypothetical protein P152DRAFT_461688 [Eremomyces bilateralis CBS 781.70]|uniref:Uncharacterized protein n=1 Tax=Eremomyces bilateralis CBS 781.70 TaxID=1392243 RepID=A0A6G1FUC7_9PEZI|nr:uncharacterized protein P152DRAFT_461688 [Eremomyces bilateralis CBS 781.70]KAF1809269.1 hypothetical protein P152DRAFT_461688 [Eremomyces bilateralis CBS 781.70]
MAVITILHILSHHPADLSHASVYNSPAADLLAGSHCSSFPAKEMNSLFSSRAVTDSSRLIDGISTRPFQLLLSQNGNQ